MPEPKYYVCGQRAITIAHPTTGSDSPLTGDEEFIVAQAAEIERLRGIDPGRAQARLERAATILHPFTHHDNTGPPIEDAVNDAFNVLEWGKTAAEEAAEAAKEKPDGREPK